MALEFELCDKRNDIQLRKIFAEKIAINMEKFQQNSK